MTIEVLDLAGYAKREESRIMVMDTRKMHAWVHYARPGEREEMHCHNQDQTMLVLEGECAMTFPDGGKSVLKPGMAALIRGGSFYALENTGSGPLIFMGTRSGPHASNKRIGYDTRQEAPARGRMLRHERDDRSTD